MELNEIKKSLYKEKPHAVFVSANKDGLLYIASLYKPQLVNIYFRVPFNDIGDAKFHIEMESQLLIRYIIQQEATSSFH